MAKFHNIDGSKYTGKTAVAQVGLWAKVFENAGTTNTDIQHLAIAWLERLQPLSKSEIKEDIEGKYLFTNFPTGLDRGSLVAWVHKYSPIRVKFERSTGRFEGLGVARKGAWDVDGASLELWTECDPERIRKFKAAELEKIITQAAQVIAKVAYQEAKQTTDVRESMQRMLDEGLTGAITEYMISEKFFAWAEECDAAKIAETRNH